jgi:hypothetical protein
MVRTVPNKVTNEPGAEIADALAVVSAKGPGDGDVMRAVLAELDRRYRAADEAVEQALAHREAIASARNIVKARAESSSAAPSALSDAATASDDRTSLRETSAGTASSASNGRPDPTKTAVASAKPRPAREAGARRSTSPSSDADVPRAVSWPRGPRLGGELYQRANYGRIIGCVAEGLDRQAAVRDALGLKQSTAQMAMSKLVDEGLLAQSDDGSYALTDAGRSAYEELAAEFGRKEVEAV